MQEVVRRRRSGVWRKGSGEGGAQGLKGLVPLLACLVHIVIVLNARTEMESSSGSMTGDSGGRRIDYGDFRPEDGEEVELESNVSDRERSSRGAGTTPDCVGGGRRRRRVLCGAVLGGTRLLRHYQGPDPRRRRAVAKCW